MKRRLALLLALSLTFASFPVAGAGAAETETPAAVEQTLEQAETETVTENEEAAAAGSSEAAAVVEEASGEAASSEETAAVEVETTEEKEVVEETEETEAAPEEEAAAAATTSAEAAPVVEPVAVKVDPNTVVEEKKTEKIADGWQQNNTVYYKNGKKVTGLQVLTFNGTARTFFFDKNGVKKTGWVTIDNKGTVCYFADSRWPSLPAGAMLTGFRKIGNYWFYMADSSYAKAHNVPRGKQLTGWQYINNKTYYFATGSGSWPTGAAYEGWKTISGKLYYFADSNYTAQHEGSMLSGWKTIKGKTFFFADSRYPSQTRGTPVKGLVKIGNKYFLFGSNAAQIKGWTTYNGRVAYYNTSNGAAAKGWHAKGSSWYYTYENGLARYGWIKLGNSLYYLNPAQGGKMATGSVLMESGKLMFFDSEGRRATTKGWKTVGAYTYYTYANGTCARNTTIEGVKLDSMGRSKMTAMDRKAQGYSSDTNYLILVNKGEYKVCIYKGRKNGWAKVKEWYCTHGGSNTPNGTWRLDDHVTKRSAKYGWAVFDYSSAAFATHISAGNYFHSILYEKYIGEYYPNTNPYSEEPMDPALKKDYSHGCVRLETQNAEWIWDNVPLGTKVVVY
ncbi:MAG: L,D-transpeptidase family protein [Lachnospiraceae bacterium]|nr:L,D-transpeptidase family protein [Lachnospiraceae bacterium]